jgi:glycosyltransferase involved in cell wall biosynthesis
MLKICHIISGDLWAGKEVMIYSLLKGLKKYNNLTLSTILFNEGRLAEEIRKLGIRVHVTDESKISFFNILLATRKIFSKRPPDVIHSHNYKENILAYLSSRSIRSPKLIATHHGIQEVYRKDTRLQHRLISKCNFFVLSRCFQRVVGVSQDIQKALKQYGFSNNKVCVIHNGIEIPDITPNKDNGETFVIGSSGRLFPVKDYPFMVEIAKAILEKTTHIRFQLAGDGPERSKLQALIEEYGLNDVFVLKGHLEDISAFYQGLDLYLNTSIHEGIPMSILEAMAYQLPVVAPKVGGFKEIVEEGVQGYLLEERNPKAFAEKCILLYENKALRQKMAQAAREKVMREFSLEKMAQNYFNVYLELAMKG